jgi:hypothetical protein
MIIENASDAPPGEALGNPDEEAAALWLYELYGMHRDVVLVIAVVVDGATGEKIQFEVNDASNKVVLEAAQRTAMNHKCHILTAIPDDFKEYSRRLGEDVYAIECENGGLDGVPVGGFLASWRILLLGIVRGLILPVKLSLIRTISCLCVEARGDVLLWG